MNAFQKQRALRLIEGWDKVTKAVTPAATYFKGQQMADLLQEPVGYLYTNVQSGECHVSDYDDDYRGPERAMWHIEPVYRRAKGQA